MSTEAAIAALKDKGIEIDLNPASVKAKSRDFFWYSPVLKDRLDHVVADFVATPKSEAEVIEVLRVCYAEDVPVTTRGTGTGNYGQAIPLAGGCILHLNKMDTVKEIHPGRVICEPGVLLKDLDAACNETGQEIRMFSSTWATATVGGFIAGGSGGIGSVRWGALRDPGNILRLKVVTMEEEPRVLEITGNDLHRVSHAYGTNGIITELELPLAPAYDWKGIFIAFSDFDEALRYSYDLAACDGLLIKLASVYEAPIAKDYFQRVAPYVEEADALVGLMVAPHAMAPWETFTADYPGAKVIYIQGETEWKRDPGPVFEYGWNHTTLRALKVDPSITYLQIAYGTDDPIALVHKVRERLYPEVLQHVEVTRANGKVAMGSLTLVKYTTEERLDEIIAIHEEMGAMNFNPHRYTLEEGGRQAVDERQLEFKREADPKGLLNPGKMIAWDDPNWAYEKMYAYPGLKPKAAAE
ncbi:MAG: FAD-binding oxidoreductase [Paracoccaceae bacterium]|nr:FAD-binding oxidoreductase [Paracoccaceae bacterium]